MMSGMVHHAERDDYIGSFSGRWYQLGERMYNGHHSQRKRQCNQLGGMLGKSQLASFQDAFQSLEHR